jgi:hypothetical protein
MIPMPSAHAGATVARFDEKSRIGSSGSTDEPAGIQWPLWFARSATIRG